MNTETECLFCKKYEEGSEVVWENEFFFMQFDLFPINPGHAEVIPKRHVDSLLDLDQDEWESLQDALYSASVIITGSDLQQVYENMLENPLNESSEKFCLGALETLEKSGLSPDYQTLPDGYNFGVNDGEAAGRTVHHLHIHVIPRYFDDVENPRGGVRNLMPGKGSY